MELKFRKKENFLFCDLFGLFFFIKTSLHRIEAQNSSFFVAVDSVEGDRKTLSILQGTNKKTEKKTLIFPTNFLCDYEEILL